jgi:hypothetical protein
MVYASVPLNEGGKLSIDQEVVFHGNDVVMFATAFDAYDAAFDVEFSPTSVKMDELMTRFDDV